MEGTSSLIFGVCKRLEKQTGVNAWAYRVLFLLTIGYGGGFVYLLLTLLD